MLLLGGQCLKEGGTYFNIYFGLMETTINNYFLEM